MTSKATAPVRGTPQRADMPEGSVLDRLVCTTRILAWQGRPVTAADVDLVAAAGPDGVLFQHGDFGLAGRGVAACLPLSEGLKDENSVRKIGAALSAVPCSSEVTWPGAGPVVLGALPFDRTATGCLTLPSVVIGRRGGDVWITVTRDRDDDAAVALVEEAMIAAALGAVTPPPAAAPRTYTLTSVREPAEWESLVAAAVDRIETGDFEKVVLARQVEVLSDKPFSIGEILNRLTALFPTCMIFKIGDFLGASPELLVERRGTAVASHPLAGTVGRSGDHATDAALIAELLASAKERREHALVVKGLVNALAPLCTWLETPDVPEVMELRNVCHLATRLTGELAVRPVQTSRATEPVVQSAAAGPDVPAVLELVAAVHPSPAVGGSPGPESVAYLQDAEGFDRGLFAGPVGWMDARGDGTFAIALRSAEVSGKRAVMYAGVGVVRGSRPADELQETQLKLQALLAALVRP